ncbi:MAG: carbohydrate ABC transporter permease [Lachnospiraceae bacterium]|nr:carbohydrate ABC transporter permease [Lachnospiraceae bacterium]MBR6271571.1 carbohydrate ABC transporter permease [Lachnospiraceae bacterium]
MKRIKPLNRKPLSEKILYNCISVLFAVVAFSYIYILVWTFISSMKTHTEIVMNPFSLPEEWHWEHFVEMFSVFKVNGHGFFSMLFNSIWFSVGGALLMHLTSVSFAYVSTKYTFPGSRWVYTIVLIMMTLPVYGSQGAMYRLLRTLGLVDSYLHIVISISGFTSAYLYYHAFFKNLSWSYAEAAMMDGANDFQIFFRVMLPQSKPIFTALFLTTWLTAWNNYESPLVYLPNLPTLPVGIYQFDRMMMFEARLDILFAACLVVSIPALIIFIIFNKTLTTSLSIGGIKG